MIKVISFRGLYNLLYFSVSKRPWHVFFIFLLNIDHYTLFAATICILQLILHGLNDKPARETPFKRYFEILHTPGYSVAHSTFVYKPIF